MPIVNNFPPASSSGIFPGMILMWSGTIDTIPGGWQLCDGTNGTPNLVDRFIVGAGNSYNVGGTGGSASVTLTTAQMPSHTHSGSVNISQGGSHKHKLWYLQYSSASPDWDGSSHDVLELNTDVGNRYWYDDYDYYDGFIYTDGDEGGYNDGTGTGGVHSHTGTATIGSTGSGSSHENRPPYYALAYIMKL